MNYTILITKLDPSLNLRISFLTFNQLSSPMKQELVFRMSPSVLAIAPQFDSTGTHCTGTNLKSRQITDILQYVQPVKYLIIDNSQNIYQGTILVTTKEIPYFQSDIEMITVPDAQVRPLSVCFYHSRYKRS